MRYFDYEIKYIGKDGDKWIAYSTGENRDAAISHFNYWQQPGNLLVHDLPIVSIRSKGSSEEYPYLLEDALETALKDKDAAIATVQEDYLHSINLIHDTNGPDGLEDGTINLLMQDCIDLTEAIRNCDHGRIDRLDTMVRERFITLMLGEDKVRELSGQDDSDE